MTDNDKYLVERSGNSPLRLKGEGHPCRECGGRTVKFWIPSQYYGGDIDLIAQAAQDCGAELVAVKGYPIEAYPFDREYVEGAAMYLFSVELPCEDGEEQEKHEIAGNVVYTNVHMALRNRYQEKYPELA